MSEFREITPGLFRDIITYEMPNYIQLELVIYTHGLTKKLLRLFNALISSP